MPKAFVMLTVKVGTDPAVVEKLKRLNRVTGVFEVYSLYDIVVEVEADTLDEIQETVSKVRRLEDVISTNTMVVAKR